MIEFSPRVFVATFVTYIVYRKKILLWIETAKIVLLISLIVLVCTHLYHGTLYKPKLTENSALMEAMKEIESYLYPKTRKFTVVNNNTQKSTDQVCRDMVQTFRDAHNHLYAHGKLYNNKRE
jgi:sensor histidine kinase YesM